MNLRNNNTYVDAAAAMLPKLGPLTSKNIEEMLKDPNNPDFIALQAVMIENIVREEMIELRAYRDEMQAITRRKIEDEIFFDEQKHKAKVEEHQQLDALLERQRQLPQENSQVSNNNQLMSDLQKLANAYVELKGLEALYDSHVAFHDKITQQWQDTRNEYAAEVEKALGEFDIDLPNGMQAIIRLSTDERAEIADRLRRREIPIDVIARHLPEKQKVYEAEVARHEETMLNALQEKHQKSGKEEMDEGPLNVVDVYEPSLNELIKIRQQAEQKAQKEMNIDGRVELLDLINVLPAVISAARKDQRLKALIENMPIEQRRRLNASLEESLRNGPLNYLMQMANGEKRNVRDILDDLNDSRVNNNAAIKTIADAHDRKAAAIDSFAEAVERSLAKKREQNGTVLVDAFEKMRAKHLPHPKPRAARVKEEKEEEQQYIPRTRLSRNSRSE